MKAFVSGGYALDRSPKTKLNPRSVPIILVGYADERKSYVVLYTTTNHVGYCRTLQLDEEEATIRVEKTRHLFIKKYYDGNAAHLWETIIDPNP